MQYPDPLVDMMLILEITFLTVGNDGLSDIMPFDKSVCLRSEIILRLTKFILSKYC